MTRRRACASEQATPQSKAQLSVNKDFSLIRTMNLNYTNLHSVSRKIRARVIFVLWVRLACAVLRAHTSYMLSGCCQNLSSFSRLHKVAGNGSTESTLHALRHTTNLTTRFRNLLIADKWLANSTLSQQTIVWFCSWASYVDCPGARAYVPNVMRMCAIQLLKRSILSVDRKKLINTSSFHFSIGPGNSGRVFVWLHGNLMAALHHPTIVSAIWIAMRTEMVLIKPITGRCFVSAEFIHLRCNN